MSKVILIFLIFMSLTSCRITDIAVKEGFYETWNGTKQLIRNDSLKLLFIYEQRERLVFFSDSLKLDSSLNRYNRQILKDFEFDRKTDTLYFFNTWTYCFQQEQIDPTKFSHEMIDSTMCPIERNTLSVKTPAVLQRILMNKRHKRILVQHVLPFRNKYLSFVYVLQSYTQKNKDIKPRQWNYNFNVTDKSDMLFVAKSIYKYIEYTRKNFVLLQEEGGYDVNKK